VTYNPDDRHLTQYLLGSLPSEETERLDELSIADDDFAAKLNSAEKDLVDAHVRGELPAADAHHFKSAYLSSPKRREKVRFAETFLSFERRAATQPVAVRAEVTQSEKHESVWKRLLGGVWSGTLRSPNTWFAPQWGLVAAALLLLIASGYLLNTNLELRQQVSRSDSERALLAQKEQQLQHQLAIRASRQRGETRDGDRGTVSVVRTLERSAGVWPIDVRPFQREVFRWTHAGGESDCKNRPIMRLESRRQECSGLLCTENLHLPTAEPRQLGAVRRILQEKPPSDGLADGGAKNRMGVADGASRPTAVDHFMICVLHVERGDCG